MVLVGWDTLDAPTYRYEPLEGYQGGRQFDDGLLDQRGGLRLPAMRAMKLAWWTKSLQPFPALFPKKRPDFLDGPYPHRSLRCCGTAYKSICFSFVSVGSKAVSLKLSSIGQLDLGTGLTR